jgi:isoleucyl-tRNA synthetase
MCEADDERRRASQHVIWSALRCLSSTVSPVMPFFVKELSAYLPGSAKGQDLSQLEGWSAHRPEWRDEDIAARWRVVKRVRDEVNSLLDEVRGKGDIATGLETTLHISGASPGVVDALEVFGGDLEDIFGTSGVRISAGIGAGHGASSSTMVGEEEDGEEGKTIASSELHASDGVCSEEVESDAVTGSDGTSMSFRIELRMSAAPKCERCWKHQPAAEGTEGSAQAVSVELAGEGEEECKDSAPHLCARCWDLTSSLRE